MTAQKMADSFSSDVDKDIAYRDIIRAQIKVGDFVGAERNLKDLARRAYWLDYADMFEDMIAAGELGRADREVLEALREAAGDARKEVTGAAAAALRKLSRQK